MLQALKLLIPNLQKQNYSHILTGVTTCEAVAVVIGTLLTTPVVVLQLKCCTLPEAHFKSQLG